MNICRDLAAARITGRLRVKNIDARRLLRLSRFPQTEPYWGRQRAYRLDDPAQRFGTTYTAFSLEVAFAETVLHQEGYFTGDQWLIDEENILRRHVVTYSRPEKSKLLIADLTGASLKALGLNNDLSSSDDYAASMAISGALHVQVPDVDGILYVSRQMNIGRAVALFERSGITAGNAATRLVDHPGYPKLLNIFNVAILPTGRAS